MTTPDSDILEHHNPNKHGRTVPEIKGEEDLPFPVAAESSSVAAVRKPADERLNQTDELTKFRFETGRIVLYVAMGAMGFMVLLDLFSGVEENAMLENAFEAFKLITMTVLGYIFGSSGSGNSSSSQ